MALKLFDLAGADAAVRFSPFCWRARMALAHKGLEVETVPWRFTEKEVIAFSGQGRVPVLVDGERVVHDSFAIARYLEEAYPDRPSLFGGPVGEGLTLFVKNWTERAIHPLLLRLVLPELFAGLAEIDKGYFRESREARFGAPLEAVAVAPAEGLPALRAALTPARATLEQQPFLAGGDPAFADYLLFGAFMWARAVSRIELLETDDPVHGWMERLLDAFDGLARRAPRNAA